MEDLFVPYDLSVKLKEIGFAEECFARYRRGKFQANTLCRLIDYNTHPVVVGDISAPLFQQAFDFFLEKSLIRKYGVYKAGYYGYGFDIDEEEYINLDKGWSLKEAQISCIDKIFEIFIAS